MSTYNVISADSHVVEPANLWLDYIDPTYRSRAPHLERKGDIDYFVCDGQDVAPPFGFSVAGRALEGTPRTWPEGVYKGAYDPTARIEHQRQDGIDAEVVYPSIGLRLYALKDKTLKYACLEAYNRWMGDFRKVHPERYKGIAMIAVDDVERAVGDLREAHRLGLAGAMTTVASDDPSLYHGKVLDPFWSTAAELGMSVSLHIISNAQQMDLRSELESVLYHMHIQRSLANMLFGGVFVRFPKLRIVSAENDAGWVPYFMERMDYVSTQGRRQKFQQHALKGAPMKASQYLKQCVYYTFMRDRSAVDVRHLVGIENLMWSSDYPHNDSTFPNSQKKLDELFAGVPAKERHQMVAANAERFYHFA